MKNILTKSIIAFAVVVIMAVSILPTCRVDAKTSLMEGQSSGKTIYYSDAARTIYQLDSSTGKAKKVKTINGVSVVSYISVYDGNIYFAAYDDKTNEKTMYRITCSGKNLKKLGKGDQLSIYDKKIYFIDHSGSICVMSLNGKNKKTIIKNSEKEYINGCDGFLPGATYAIANGKIYFSRKNAKTNYSKIESYTISTKKTNVVKSYKYENTLSHFSTDGTYVFFSESYPDRSNGMLLWNSRDCVMKLSNNKISTMSLGSLTHYYGGYSAQNGILYFTNEKGNFCSYNVKSKKTKTLKKNLNVEYVVFGKDNYALAYVSMSDAECAANDYNYTGYTAKVKLTGNNYKTLQKIFLW